MKSVIARKRGNLTAAAEYLDSACTILESIPNINVAFFPFSSLDQQDHRMSLRTHLPPSAQRRSRPARCVSNPPSSRSLSSAATPGTTPIVASGRFSLFFPQFPRGGSGTPLHQPARRQAAPRRLVVPRRPLARPNRTETPRSRSAASVVLPQSLQLRAQYHRQLSQVRFSPFFGRVTSSATQPPAARWRDFSRERRFASNMKCCTRWIFSTPWCRFPREGSGRKRSGWRGWSERGFRCGTQGVV